MSLTYEAHPLGPPNNYIIAHGDWSRGQQLMKRSHHGNNQQIMLRLMSLGSHILSSVHYWLNLALHFHYSLNAITCLSKL